MNKQEKKYDLDALKELCGDDQAFYGDMIRTFFRTTRESLAAMEQALQQGNWPVVAGLAHKMRGPCTHLGIDTLSGLLTQIENDVVIHEKTAELPGLVGQALAEGETVIRLIAEETGFSA